MFFPRKDVAFNFEVSLVFLGGQKYGLALVIISFLGSLIFFCLVLGFANRKCSNRERGIHRKKQNEFFVKTLTASSSYPMDPMATF